MNGIVKFTNTKEEVNHGIIIDTHVDGMIYVIWDNFVSLLTRLEREGKVNDFVRANLSKRKSWIRIIDAIPTGAKTELLPIDAPVQWNDAELKALQAKMIKEAINHE